MFKMRFKNLTYLLIASLCFSSISCVDLEEDPSKVQLSPQALTSVGTLRDLVTGMYRAHQNTAQWTDYYTNAYGGDDVTTHSGLNKVGFREADWRNQTIDSDRTLRPYEGSYNVIAIANMAIAAKDDIMASPTEEAEKDRYLGECYFFRAWEP